MVDLSIGTAGLITFRSGEQFWCPVIAPRGPAFRVRYESGWYVRYSRDGVQQQSGTVQRADGSIEIVVNPQRDIVRFEPCAYRHDYPGEIRP